MVAVVLVALVALLAVVLAACSPSGDSPAPARTSLAPSTAPSEPPSPTAIPSPAAIASPVERTAIVAATIPLGAQGTAMALSDRTVWVRFVDGSVARVDMATDKVSAKIPVGTGEYGSLAAGEGAVWVTTFDEDKVSRIDPSTDKVVAEIAVGKNPEGIAVTPGAVWVSNHRGGSISRIDPATNTVVATITFGKTGPSGPKDIRVSHGSLWTTVPNMGLVVRIDPATNKVIATIKVVAVEELVLGTEALYASGFRGQFYQIDPGANVVVRKFDPGEAPWTFAEDAYWGVDGTDLLRIAPDTFDPTDVWHVAGPQTDYRAIAFDAASIWLVTDTSSLLRIELPT